MSRFPMHRALVALALAALTACRTALPYASSEGPAVLPPTYPPEISLGQLTAFGQSPIDIPLDEVVSSGNHGLPRLEFDYAGDITVDLVNTGSPEEEATVRAVVPSGAGHLTVDGVTYQLLQFHWHTPAEHEVDGVRLPLEMHLVHRADDGTLMVVGVLMQPGRLNPEVATLFGLLPDEEGMHAEARHVNLRLLLPSRLESYRYSGSLTTAPYTEGVRWAVLAQPVELASRQLGAFQALFPEGNSREVQSPNGRVVTTDLR